MTIYTSPQPRGLSTLEMKFVGWYIRWNAMVLHRNWTSQTTDNVYVEGYTLKNSFTYAENDDGSV